MLTALLVIALASGCTVDAQAAGLCPSVSNDGSTVEIGATRPGAGDSDRPDDDGPGSGGSGGLEESGGWGGAPGTAPNPCANPQILGGCLIVEVIRPTLADVASFAPASVAIIDEPDGVGIVGMPVNFVTGPTAHEQAGTLFGLPVTVRFTPIGVVFVHGDGTQRTTTSGGATWAELGLPQFSATGTSHAYASRGTYTARALIRYAAEFNLGRGWNPIDRAPGDPDGRDRPSDLRGAHRARRPHLRGVPRRARMLTHPPRRLRP